MPKSREEDVLRNTSVSHFLPQNYLPLRWGGGHGINNFLSSYPTNATYQIWLRLHDQVVIEKMLTDNGQCMRMDANP